MLPVNPTDAEVHKLWQELALIPLDSDDRLEEPFHDYSIGDHIQNVWLWFDNYIPVHTLLY